MKPCRPSELRHIVAAEPTTPAVVRAQKPTAATRQGTPSVRVSSKRFGDFEVGEERVLRFPLGLPGFPDAKEFVLVEHHPGSKFKWLQAIDRADLAFLVIDPVFVVHDFPVERVPAAMGFCDLERGEEVAVLAICRVPPEPMPATVNLLAPIGLGLRSRRGAQVNVHDTGFTTEMPLVLHT